MTHDELEKAFDREHSLNSANFTIIDKNFIEVKADFKDTWTDISGIKKKIGSQNAKISLISVAAAAVFYIFAAHFKTIDEKIDEIRDEIVDLRR